MFNHINTNMINKRLLQSNIDMNIHSRKIMDILKREKVVTSSEIAKSLKISWNTADKYLLELLVEGKLERIKKEGVNLWLRK